MQGKSVGDIINDWSSELEAQCRSFVRYAETLADWDAHILRSRAALLELEHEIAKVRGRFHQQLLQNLTASHFAWYSCSRA